MGNQSSNPSSQVQNNPPPRPPPPSQVRTPPPVQNNPVVPPTCGPDCQKQREIQAAFQSYQRARDLKDRDPATYELLRFRYFSLLENGREWAIQERTRMVTRDVNPLLKRYEDQWYGVQAEYTKQRELVDIVEAIKRQQSNMKNSLESQMNIIGESVNEKKNKIQVFQRSVELEGSRKDNPAQALTMSTGDRIAAYFATFPESFTTILDVSIVILGFLMIIVYYKKIKTTAGDIGRKFNQGGVGYALPAVPGTQAIATAISSSGGLLGFTKKYLPFVAFLSIILFIIVNIIYARP